MNYNDIVKQMEKNRIKITAKQRLQIRSIYRTVARDYNAEIKRKGSSVDTTNMQMYADELKRQSYYIFNDIQKVIQTGIDDTAKAVTDSQIKYWGSINPVVMNRLRDSMNDVPQHVVNEIVSGNLYHDGNGLSSRVWRARYQYEKDIDYIINQGIIAKKSAFDMAKDLEKYVNPDVMTDFEWNKVYPGCNKVVDYNAQRLARTATTHAYQIAMERTNNDNPFVEAYQWHSSNGGRVCPLCKERDGQIFKKGSVPLDHPNGMCVVIPVVEKSYDEIGDEIAEWVNGASNPALDNWLK